MTVNLRFSDVAQYTLVMGKEQVRYGLSAEGSVQKRVRDSCNYPGQAIGL